MAFLLLKGIPSLAGQNQAPQADPDDFVDRLNYRYTVILLNVFSAVVTNRQFSSKQIQCKTKLPSNDLQTTLLVLSICFS